MKPLPSRLGVLSGLFLAAVGAIGCGSTPETTPQGAPVVRYIPVAKEDITDYEFFTGRAEAIDYVEVRARVTGYLTEINFKPGSRIKKFDPKDPKSKPLFKIDPRPYQAALDQATGALGLAKARLNLAKADLARAKELAKTPGAISQQDLDKYAAAEEEAAAAVTAATASTESAKLNVEFTDVGSPIDGYVSRNLLTLGNLVTQDTTLLTTIISEDPMYGYFDIDERTLLRIQELVREGKIESAKNGQYPVDLGLANEEDPITKEALYPHTGTIDFINTQVNPSTGTLQVRGIFENPQADPSKPRMLTSGQFIRVRVPLGKKYPSLIVPQAAIARDQGKKYLLVINDKDVVEYRPITLGPEVSGGKQAVNPVKIVRSDKGIRLAEPGEKGAEESLKVKERVIVGGLQKVRPGMTVEPKPMETLAGKAP
jgi:RND family efflux transporter MFP subunit